jgi:hypothetical protein
MKEEDSMQQITAEFKNAARSVAALYKLSVQQHTQMKSQGYLECLEDLLQVLKSNENVQEWALRKKLELELECATGGNKDGESSVFIDHEKSSLIIPDDYSFTMSSPMTAKFPPSNPLLSVERRPARQISKSRCIRTKEAQEPEDEDLCVSPVDDSLKRRVLGGKADVKKPKY